MSTLSIVITAYNEEKKIRVCLESAKFADELIFVDNSSTDNTAKIAKEYTKHVYSQPNEPTKIDLQKNTGIEKATSDWVLVLDADEQISSELRKEIKEVLEDDPKELNGFWMPRKNIIFDKWIQHCGWYPDFQLRLFRKGKGKYEKVHYHEPIAVVGQTAKLREHLIHSNYERIGQVLHRNLQVYAPNEADELIRQGYSFNARDAIRLPIQEFLSRYFARQGYKDGFHGLMLSLFMAIYHFIIFAYIWEKKKFADEGEKSVKAFESEFKESSKEIRYWVQKRQIDEERASLKKIGLRVKRKLRI